MHKIVFKTLLILFSVHSIYAQSSLVRGEFLYDGKNIRIGSDDIEKIQQEFKNNFSIDHESTVSKGMVGYVNINEDGISVNKIVATPSLFFDFRKSNRELQKATLTFFVDNAKAEADFKFAVKMISRQLPLLKLYTNKNKQIVYYNGLRIEFIKKKEDELGYSIEVDVERNSPLLRI